MRAPPHTRRPLQPPTTRSAARGLWLLCALCLGVLVGGCSPEVGDACETALDCPTPAQSICDLSVPDGYCLLPVCEVNGDCPEEAVCVRFDRFETYCMLGCSSDSDCRSGQTCRRDVQGSDPFCYTPLPSDEAPFTRPDASDTDIFVSDASNADTSDTPDTSNNDTSSADTFVNDTSDTPDSDTSSADTAESDTSTEDASEGDAADTSSGDAENDVSDVAEGDTDAAP